jgi:hypothetical protein
LINPYDTRSQKNNDENFTIYFLTYSLRPAKTVRLAFKFFATKIVRLNCSKVYLIKAISNTKKELHWEVYGTNQMLN